MTEIITRFAPSPTGLVHTGNIRTALFNYLYAQKHKAKFCLRIEDTDIVRSKPEYTRALMTDLQWLGLNWQGEVWYQSQRTRVYQKYFEQLFNQHLVYHCFCSPEQLERTRKAQLASGQPPKYPGTCRHLTPFDIQTKINSGLKPAIRFKVTDDITIKFKDLIKGEQIFYGKDIGDFIIQRQDQTVGFFFSNAIDDSEYGVTHVLRGDDHLSNTPRQILILQSLDLRIPVYGHFALINGLDGAKFSKRNGSMTVQELRAVGYLPLALNNYLARLGHYYSNPNWMDLSELIANFDLSQVSHSPAKYDPAQVTFWQKTAVQKLSPNDFLNWVKKYIANIVPEDKLLKFTEIIQPNVILPQDARYWAEILFTDINYDDNARTIFNNTGPEFFDHAINVSGNLKNYQLFIQELKSRSQCSGKKLFLPVRLALTGQEHGPDLAGIFDLMSQEQITSRFNLAKKYA